MIFSEGWVIGVYHFGSNEGPTHTTTSVSMSVIFRKPCLGHFENHSFCILQQISPIECVPNCSFINDTLQKFHSADSNH